MMEQEVGHSPDGAGLSQAEPKVSALRASIPSARSLVDQVKSGPLMHNDPEFVAAWRQFEAAGYMYSDGNIELVHMGWLIAKAKTACNHPATHSEGWEAVCDICGDRYAADGGA